MDSSDPIRQTLTTAYVDPRNDLEGALTRIWREALGLPAIGVLDDFFELGGYSLLAIQIVTDMRKLLNVEFPVADFALYPTIAAQAEVIAQTLAAAVGGQLPPEEAGEA
jgi:hypothetical protein